MNLRRVSLKYLGFKLFRASYRYMNTLWIDSHLLKSMAFKKKIVHKVLCTDSSWITHIVQHSNHDGTWRMCSTCMVKTHSQCWETRLLEIPGGVFHSRVSPPLNGDLKRDQEYHHLDWRNLQKPLGKVKIKFILFLKSWTVCTILHRYEFLNELWFCFCNLTFI